MPGPTIGPCPVVYQLRVVLAGISPLIWRRLLVTDQTTIAELHTVLQLAFGWSDEHLHCFTIHGREYSNARDGGPWFSDNPHRVKLARFGLRAGERFVYEYNFFAPWRHDLRVEKILTSVPGRTYPRCIGGARAAPPEECGGPWAFLALRQEHSAWATTVRMAELVRLLLDAPPRRTVREVLGEAMDELPHLLYWSRIDTFDRRAVNRALSARFHPKDDP